MPLWKTWPDLDPSFGFRCWVSFFVTCFSISTSYVLITSHLKCSVLFGSMQNFVDQTGFLHWEQKIVVHEGVHACIYVLLCWERVCEWLEKKGSIYPNQVTLISLLLDLDLKIKYLKFMHGVGNSIPALSAEYVGTLVFLSSEWKTGLLPLDQGNLAVVHVHVLVTASVHLYAADATPYLRQHACGVFIIIFVDGSRGYITGDITNTSNICQTTKFRAWWLLCSGAFYLYTKRKLSKGFQIYQWDKTFEVYKMLCGWVVKRRHFGCRPVRTLVQAVTFFYTFLISQGPHGPCRCFIFWNWESDCTRPCRCVLCLEWAVGGLWSRSHNERPPSF